jgi:hypothetical protein
VKLSSSTDSTRVTRGHQRGRWYASPTIAQSSCGDAGSVRVRRTVATGYSAS